MHTEHFVVKCYVICHIFSNGPGKNHMYIFKIKMSQTYEIIVKNKRNDKCKGHPTMDGKADSHEQPLFNEAFPGGMFYQTKHSSVLLALSPTPIMKSHHEGKERMTKRYSLLLKAIPQY